MIVVTFADHGKKFNPLDTAAPDVSLQAEDRDPGGLGIIMVKKLMDDVKYEYTNGRNVLRVSKKI